MGSFGRMVIALSLLLGWQSLPTRAVFSTSLDTIADKVIGQSDFMTGTAGTSASKFSSPRAVAFDAQGNLYLADWSNNRVLEFDAPLTSGQSASRVFGQPDFASGTANNGGVSAASLFGPFGVALDRQGNLYVTDGWNHRVLEYDTPLTSGVTAHQYASRVFGQPNFVSNTQNNGGVTADSLYLPTAVALDFDGNLFVNDSANNRVLEYFAPLGPNRSANQVFGQPNFTSNLVNPVSAASLYTPDGLAFDSFGNLYVVDKGDNRVLEYNAPLWSSQSANLVIGQPDFTSSLANNGGVLATSLNFPISLAVDPAGNLYVADFSNNRVLEYNAPLSSGQAANRVFGQPNFNSNIANNGGLSASSLSNPIGVGIDPQGNLYVADLGNNRALEYDLPIANAVPRIDALVPGAVAAGGPGLTLTVKGGGFVAGSVVNWGGVARPTSFLDFSHLTIKVSAADIASSRALAVTVHTPLPGGGDSPLKNLDIYPVITGDALADWALGQPDFKTGLDSNPVLTASAYLSSPFSVAVDPHSGRLFVADTFHNRVLSWPSSKAYQNGQAADLVIGQRNFESVDANPGGAGAGTLKGPRGVAVDGQGNLYVSDFGNHRVLVYKAPLLIGLEASLVFGQGGSFANTIANNGGVSANSLQNPQGLALDAQGNLYVADSGNHRVLEYNTPLASDTTADWVFGQSNFTTNTANANGLSASSLNYPEQVALDGSGNLYVVDTLNCRVLEYAVPLASDTVADWVYGQPNFNTNICNNGVVSAASLGNPTGVGVDLFGNVYITDYSNNRVLEYEKNVRTAFRVFGQPDFTSGLVNNGGISAASLRTPFGLALDGRGNLYLADTGNNRVLMYRMTRQTFISIVRR